MRVCPYRVFEMSVNSKEERSHLSIKGKVKAWVLVETSVCGKSGGLFSLRLMP